MTKLTTDLIFQYYQDGSSGKVPILSTLIQFLWNTYYKEKTKFHKFTSVRFDLHKSHGKCVVTWTGNKQMNVIKKLYKDSIVPGGGATQL